MIRHASPTRAPDPYLPQGADRAETDRADLPALRFRQTFGAIRRRWWLVLLCAAAGAGVGEYSHRAAEQSYTARATLRLVDSRRALTGNIVDGGGDRGGKTSLDPTLSQIELLMSRSTAAQVVDSGDPVGLRVKARGFPVSYLTDVRIVGERPGTRTDTLRLTFAPDSLTMEGRVGRMRMAYGVATEIDAVRFAVQRPPDVERGLLLLLPRDAAIDALRERLQAIPRPKTDIVEVEYRAHDPIVAQRVVNTVVTSFRSSNAHSAQQQSRRRREFVEAQLRRNDSLLIAAESTLSAFRREEQAFSSRDKFVTERSELADANRRIDELTAERARYGAALAVLRASDSATDVPVHALAQSPELLGNPVTAQLFAQLSRFQSERDSLTVGAFARARGGPDVARLDTLLTTTKGKLVAAIGGMIASVDTRLSAFGRARTRSASELQRLPAVEAQEVRHTQRVASIRAITDQLRMEYQKAQIDEAVEAGQVEIVDLATRPRRPDGLPHSTILILGVIVGLALGAAGALFAERDNQRIRRRDELQRLVGVRELAVIPRLPLAPSAPPARDKAQKAIARPDAPRAALTPAVAEPYRMLRTNLVLSNAGHDLHSIVVSSPSPEEGKTTVASNLAVSFARQGMKVLLIDGDLMRPSLHRGLGVALAPGLADVLLGRVSAADAMRWIATDGVTVIPAGRLAPEDDGALLERGIRRLLETVRADFDMIVIDAPPLLVASDAVMLGSLADGVVLVVRAGQTECDDVVDAIRQLDAVNVRVLGTVLNDPDARLEGYGRRHYYSYSYAGVAAP